MMRTYGVIMAGGGGTRFWPLSRRETPKQFLKLSGKESMVNETIDRLTGIAGKEDIFVVTNVTQADKMLSETKGRILENHVLAEPAARNTAACIGYAAMEIMKKYGDGVMCVLPSDHFIKNLEEYQSVLKAAIKEAEESDKLVTIGIAPTFPSTGYGYIKYKKDHGKECCLLEEFVEKPDTDTAENYVKEGNYLWNSGMFIWKASVILNQFRQLLPDVYNCLEEIGQAMGTQKEQEILQKVYPVIPKISIDYGIMERAKEAVVFRGNFGWNDVGSFDALESIYNLDENDNVVYGENIQIDTKNCIMYAQDKMIATIGVEDLVIVETKDVVLVCKKENAQTVKNLVEKLENQEKFEHL